MAINRTVRSLSSMMAACCLICAGPASVASDLDSAEREARRYAECLNDANTDCILDLTYPQPWNLGQFRPDSFPPISTQSVLVRAGITNRPPEEKHWTLSISQPTEIDYDSELEFVLVPYRIESFLAFWFERNGYFLGVSGDNRNWCFIEDVVVAERGLENIMPGYEGPSLPPISYEPTFEPAHTETKYLATRMGAFSVRSDGVAHYTLELDVRKRIREETPLEIIFENPRDPERRYVIQTSLARKQDILGISSPMIIGFMSGETYEVIVIGKDPETGEQMFEHRQSMLYKPLETGFRDFIPAVATARHRRDGSDYNIYPRDWFQRFKVSSDKLCRGAELR